MDSVAPRRTLPLSSNVVDAAFQSPKDGQEDALLPDAAADGKLDFFSNFWPGHRRWVVRHAVLDQSTEEACVDGFDQTCIGARLGEDVALDGNEEFGGDHIALDAPRERRCSERDGDAREGRDDAVLDENLAELVAGIRLRVLRVGKEEEHRV